MNRRQLLLLGCSVISVFVVAVTPSVSHALSRAQIDDLLPKGFQTAVDWDVDCKSGLGNSNTLKFSNGLRTRINNEASYKTKMWISMRGSGKNDKPVAVPYNATNVELQINAVKFLCGPLVASDLAGSPCSSSNVTARQLYNDDARWVADSTGRYDRKPNAVGSGCQRPSLTAARYHIQKVEVTSGGGSVSGIPKGMSTTINRDGNSRYWAAGPLDKLVYKPASGITTSKTITIDITYKVVNDYRNGDVFQCSWTDGRVVKNLNDDDKCNTKTETFTVRIDPVFDFSLTPVIDSISPTSLQSGGDVTIPMGVTKTGSTASLSKSWRLSRFVLASGVTTPAINGSQTTSSLDPCAFITNEVSNSCKSIASGSRAFSANTTSLGSAIDEVNETTGQRVCYVLSIAAPTSSGSPAWRHSARHCTLVNAPPATGTLAPRVANNDSIVTPGQTTTFTYSIAKTGTALMNNVGWRVRTVVLSPTTAYPTNWGTSYAENAACPTASYRGTTGATCALLATPQGTSTFTATSGTTTQISTEDFIIPNSTPIGTRICRVLSVNPYTTTITGSRDSFVKCVLVAKYPSLQVAGGPVRTGGAFSSSATTCSLSNVSTENNDPYGILMHNYSPTTRGSFGLAALSVGRIEYFGSSNTPISANSLSRSLLFAAPTPPPFNVSGTSLGLFMGEPNGDGNLSTYCLPNLAATYKRAVPASAPLTTTGSNATNSAAAGTTRRVAFTGSNGIFTLSAATLPANQRVIIIVTQGEDSTNNTVRITGNISYGGGPYAYGTKPPQFVLLVDGDIDIEVAAGVTELNGIYSTKGNIYTCDASGKAATDTLTTTTCNQQLTVKGTMIAAKQILPYRTYGFDTTADTNPAEQFRLTPETLLSDYLWSQESLSIRTVLQRELPTRL